MGKKNLLINIEINSIKFMEFTIKKNNKKIINIENIAIPKNVENISEFIKIKIKEVLKQKKWNSHIININYYSSNLYIRGIQIPVIPKDEIPAVLKREVRKYYGEIGNQRLIYEIMGEEEKDGKKEYSIFYIIVPDEYIKNIEMLGIKINSLDFDVFALDRIFQKNLKKDENTMFVDFGFENLKLFIYNGENLSIYREINIGGDEITKTISNFLQIPYEEAEELKIGYGYISKEKTEELLEYGEKRGMYLNIAYQSVVDKIIRKLIHSIDYFKNQNKGKEINKVYLCGGGSKLKSIKELLAEELQIDTVEIYSGSDNFEYEKNIDEKFFENVVHYTNMFGMSFLDKILLKPEKIKIEKKVSTNKKTIKYKYAGLIFIFLLPLLFIYYKEFSKNKTVLNQKKKLEKNIKLISESTENYDEVLKKYNKIKKDEENLKDVVNMKNDIIDFLYDLSYITLDTIYFEKFGYRDNKIFLNGVAVSEDGFPMSSVSHFSKILEEKYKKVEIKNSKKEESNKKASFLIELEIGGEVQNGK